MEPSWIPDEETVSKANLSWLMDRVGVEDVCELHRWSVENRDVFWETVVERLGIIWAQAPTRTSTGDTQHTKWFPDGRLNIVDSVLSGSPDNPAVIHQRQGKLETVTRGELLEVVKRVAYGLTRFGEQPRVAIAMPMTLEAVVAYLATVAIGGAVVSIADSFAPEEIARRLRISDAEV
ncbi:MAG: AMP-binding protein, partial [Acidimicrobiia bacterium]|nr:AMP-binding protein [Acidimicrobiia bacterium]